ncbi:branched-chain amino acid ABC transporter permease [Pelagibius litoralis]|uniref:Branched-chain amino acid ABC transporter permease n=1 Tax=Pelagibius litoralis TaxID=374515 RepID=A0A967F1R5_9PROT|nr:branched-chain amino acid ABC transporter permease [Pelagibius litoralis]NIA71514.1 branched-chain amino acid ABC transporter permease [Pelagibius litoralis]
MTLSNPQEELNVSGRRLAAAVALMARHRVAAVLGFLLIFPFLLPYEALAVNILIYGLFALGFNMVFGYMGVLSFGHAAFFGLGSYATGIVIVHYGIHWLPAIVIGVVAAGIGAAVIGALATRTRGIYFAMVTLALSQCVYYLVYQLEDLSGGENGLRGVDVYDLGLPGLELTLLDPLTKYYFVFVFVALAVWMFSRILASPFGAVLEALRENESRARACGTNVAMSKWLAFVISGLFCGLAGALNAIHLTIVPIESLHYHTSGLAVMMSLLGGMGTFFGPFVGALTFLVLEDVITLVTVHWQLFVGALFVFFILFFPRGIWGTLLRWASR